MAEYIVHTEDGSQYKITTDDGPPPLSEPKSASGFARNVVNSAGNLVGGMATALRHPIDTAANVGDVAYGGVLKGMKALGVPGELDDEEKQRIGKFDSLVDHYKTRYSPSNIGNTIYTDPVGVAADVSMVAGGAGAALKAGGLNKAAQVANTVSQAANPLVGPARLAGKAGKAAFIKSSDAIGWNPERMYQSALKPSTALSESDVSKMVNAGLDDAIPVSKGGLKKVRKQIDDINTKVASAIKQGTEEGKTVDPVRVAGETKRSLESFKTVDPADQSAITGLRDRFLDQHSTKAPYTKVRPAADDATGYVPVGEGEVSVPKAIPLDEAQKLKQNTYRDIRESYGDQASSLREGKKDLARGLKDQIYENLPPEVRMLGPQEKVKIDLENALERFANRHGNKDMVGIGSTITGTALHAATGSNPVALVGMLAKSAMENPAVKSRVAIAIRAAKRAQKKAAAPARIRQGLNAVDRIESTQDQQ